MHKNLRLTNYFEHFFHLHRFGWWCNLNKVSLSPFHLHVLHIFSYSQRIVDKVPADIIATDHQRKDVTTRGVVVNIIQWLRATDSFQHAAFRHLQRTLTDRSPWSHPMIVIVLHASLQAALQLYVYRKMVYKGIWVNEKPIWDVAIR